MPGHGCREEGGTQIVCRFLVSRSRHRRSQANGLRWPGTCFNFTVQAVDLIAAPPGRGGEVHSGGCK